MKEEGTGSMEGIQEFRRARALRIETLAREKGLESFSKQFPDVWVSEKEKAGAGNIPSIFFTPKYNKEGEMLFQEHKISFPIQDPAQLVESLDGFNALYKAHVGAIVSDRDDPTLFIEFIADLAGKQSQPKS